MYNVTSKSVQPWETCSAELTCYRSVSACGGNVGMQTTH